MPNKVAYEVVITPVPTRRAAEMMAEAITQARGAETIFASGTRVEIRPLLVDEKMLDRMAARLATRRR
jgi:hypothetical protein